MTARAKYRRRIGSRPLLRGHPSSPRRCRAGATPNSDCCVSPRSSRASTLLIVEANQEQGLSWDLDPALVFLTTFVCAHRRDQRCSVRRHACLPGSRSAQQSGPGAHHRLDLVPGMPANGYDAGAADALDAGRRGRLHRDRGLSQGSPDAGPLRLHLRSTTGLLSCWPSACCRPAFRNQRCQDLDPVARLQHSAGRVPAGSCC